MGADHIRPRTGLEPFQAVLAQRDAEENWRTLNYAQVLEHVKRIGAALLRRED